jgi:hypothetical protein
MNGKKSKKNRNSSAVSASEMEPKTGNALLGKKRIKEASEHDNII